jgi:hypothetical protein
LEKVWEMRNGAEDGKTWERPKGEKNFDKTKYIW